MLEVGDVLPPNIHYALNQMVAEPTKFVYKWDQLGPWTQCSKLCQGKTQFCAPFVYVTNRHKCDLHQAKWSCNLCHNSVITQVWRILLCCLIHHEMSCNVFGQRSSVKCYTNFSALYSLTSLEYVISTRYNASLWPWWNCYDTAKSNNVLRDVIPFSVKLSITPVALFQGKESGDQDVSVLLMDSSYRIHAVIRRLDRVVWRKTVTLAAALGW